MPIRNGRLLGHMFMLELANHRMMMDQEQEAEVMIWMAQMLGRRLMISHSLILLVPVSTSVII